MKSIFLLGLFLTSSFAFAEDKDPLKTFIDKKEEKEKFEISLKNLTRSLNDPRLPAEVKKNLLSFVKDSDIEVYKAYVAQETKREKLEKQEKKKIVEMFSNDSAVLAGCEMSYDQKSILCPDKTYKLDDEHIVTTSNRINKKADLDTAPKGKSDTVKGSKAH